MLCTRWPIDAAIDRTAAHIPLLFFCVLQVFGLSLCLAFSSTTPCALLMTRLFSK